MIELDKIKSTYKAKESLDAELLSQLRMIREELGSNFTYKDFEYNIPDNNDAIIGIDDIIDYGDGILDIFYISNDMITTFFCLSEELLMMSRKELEALKENI